MKKIIKMTKFVNIALLLWCLHIFVLMNNSKLENQSSLYQDAINQEYAKLSDSGKKALEKYSVRVSKNDNLIEEVNISFDLSDMIICGFTDYDRKEIHLSANINAAVYAYAHEVGHAVDEMNGFPSKTDAFHKIYTSEAPAGSYEATAPEEFFAETYKLLTNGTPNEKTPLANEFVKNYL